MIIICIFVFGLPLAAYVYLFLNDQVYKWLSNSKIYMLLSLIVSVASLSCHM